MGEFIHLLSLLYLRNEEQTRLLDFLRVNVFPQVVYGNYYILQNHIRTQVKVCNCVLYLVDRPCWENQLPTWKWMCKGKHPYKSFYIHTPNWGIDGCLVFIASNMLCRLFPHPTHKVREYLNVTNNLLFFFLKEIFHTMVTKKKWISFSFLVVNLKKMENFAEILKPKNWKKKNLSLLPGPIIMVDQSNTIISINWPYWRSLYHGHHIMQVKTGFTLFEVQYLKAVLHPSYCVQAIFY